MVKKMKFWWREYCKKCDIHIKKDWWLWVSEEYAYRFKCPNCSSLNQKKYSGYGDYNWTDYSIVSQHMKCKFCSFYILDTEILKKGCSHFTSIHPNMMYKTLYFESTGDYK